MTCPGWRGSIPSSAQDDVLLGDRGFCSFAHLALLVARGAARRLPHPSAADRRFHAASGRMPGRGRRTPPKGLPRSRWLRRLGVTDQVVAWLKPEERPEWMTAEQYASLPGELVVRELRYRTGRAGVPGRAR